MQPVVSHFYFHRIVFEITSYSEYNSSHLGIKESLEIYRGCDQLGCPSRMRLRAPGLHHARHTNLTHNFGFVNVVSGLQDMYFLFLVYLWDLHFRNGLFRTSQS
jgi:hypothetical protein